MGLNWRVSGTILKVKGQQVRSAQSVREWMGQKRKNTSINDEERIIFEKLANTDAWLIKMSDGRDIIFRYLVLCNALKKHILG